MTCLIASFVWDLVTKRFIVAASAGVALALLTSAGSVRAQITYPITGTAESETGLQAVAYLVLDHKVHLGDANPAGATIQWNDGTLTSPGLLTCTGTSNSDPCYVLGTHRYALAGTYQIGITYSEPRTFGSGPARIVTTTATISPPEEFVILSIGDSVASGEGDPVVPYGGPATSDPNQGFWDDLASDYGPPP